MSQNKYDDPTFFASYSTMQRSIGGLDAAQEWPAFRALLPDLTGKRVLDLGCGFGWHCRYARDQQAEAVVGVDLSAKMLARAREMTADPAISYQQCSIEAISFPDHAFDVVISSLALHYIAHFDRVCRLVHQCLVKGGAFVLSVEHPMFTACAAQDWCYRADGERAHWPVDEYQHEGLRHTRWLADDVIKYHRTVATYVNTLIDSGFRITRLLEPTPTPEMVIAQPALKDDCRRPTFLVIAAVKAALL